MIWTLGLFSALIIGVTLGLIGGGGSILTVPVMVYLMAIDPVTATAYSLFVVGTTALIGGLQQLRKGMVDLRIAVLFAIPSLSVVFLTRRFLVPALPETLFHIGNFAVQKDLAIMVFFAVIMLAAAISMIRSGRRNAVPESAKGGKLNYPLILLEGAVVGLFTGIVGAGGGFLIIPALVLFARLPMKMAVGTSLFIIAAKSLIGFTGDLGAGMAIDWPLLLGFTGISVAGILLGIVLSRSIPGKQLKSGFGWFVLVMGTVIIISEFI